MTQPRAMQWEWRDVLWIVLFVALLIAAGYGLRDPWPADEPRFASLARDMVHSGNWLIPRVGGDLYQDKPPVFFWLLAASYWLFGSVRASFLLPSLLASLGVLLLVYDLGRRLHGREAGLLAALTLGCSLQFVITMRGAQIDGTLLLLSTLSLYGLCRHLLLGPHWRWYFVGGVAAGVGVITKGVGFLPLLAILVYAAMRGRGWAGLAIPGDEARSRLRWALAPLGLLIGMSLWGLPMLTAVATSADPALVAYRDELLVQQTVTRYTAAWHHVRPWYYFLVDVIPTLWVPLSLLSFWLVPRWLADCRARRAEVGLFLGWAALVVLFFSLSPGKRGIYILPALPALALAAAAHLPEVLRLRRVGIASLVLAGLFAIAGLALSIAYLLGQPAALQLVDDARVPTAAPLLAFTALALIGWWQASRRLAVAAWPLVLAALTVCWGFGIAPHLNGVRSARAFMSGVLSQVPKESQLGLVAYKEQFLLYLNRETVNFGHRRWLEGNREAFDAAWWLAESADRVLLVPGELLKPCFLSPATTLRIPAGVTSAESWWLVSGQPLASCVAAGDSLRVIPYPAHPVG